MDRTREDVQTPGDIQRGTQEAGDQQARPAQPGTPTEFAENQSFADPVHAEGKQDFQIPDGGLRTQETSVEEGAAAALPADGSTPSEPFIDLAQEEAGLAAASEEE